MEQDWQERPRTHCPHCGTILELKLQCKAIEVVDPAALGDRSAATNAAEHAALMAARQGGLFAPFRQVVAVAFPDNPPTDLEAFFLTVVRSLRQRLIPNYALAILKERFPSQHIAYYSGQGIGVVVVEGSLRLFVPNQVVLGTRMRQLNQKGTRIPVMLKVEDGAIKLQAWLQTAQGAVAGAGAPLHTVRNPAFGPLAVPDMAAPQ